MDKITHQVRAEHWAKIMNECIVSVGRFSPFRVGLKTRQKRQSQSI